VWPNSYAGRAWSYERAVEQAAVRGAVLRAAHPGVAAGQPRVHAGVHAAGVHAADVAGGGRAAADQPGRAGLRVVDVDALAPHRVLDGLVLDDPVLPHDDLLAGHQALLDDELLLHHGDADLVLADRRLRRHLRRVGHGPALDRDLVVAELDLLLHALGLDRLAQLDLAGRRLARADGELLLGEREPLLALPPGRPRPRSPPTLPASPCWRRGAYRRWSS
jgi:hypothetical protein